jgi:PAS domain S-box-containing protein
MAAYSPLGSIADVESFINEYYEAWHGTDQDRIMSYYAENVTVQIPGALMQGRSALQEQFVRPFITGFPGNRHVVKNMIFGRDVVVVEWSFEAEHKGPFNGHAPTDVHIEVPGCGVYEYDLEKRQITSARIYFDVGTLLKQLLDASGATTAPVEHLDLATVIKVSQTVSGEMVLEKLLDTLMRAAIEHAKAERALLILSRDAGQRIAAEATTRNDTVVVRLCDEPVTGSLLPEAVLGHVLHNRESVILDDAAILNPFSTDPYITQQHARSVFCLPLTNQAKLIGALYLENNLAPRVFAAARSAVLKLLASQAAISLENSGLYLDLAARESRVRRLVDANIIGIFIWELKGRILEANDAFLNMVEYDREDLIAGRLRWSELTPPEWRDQEEQHWIPKIKMSGSLPPYEKEYFRKDRSRVPVLVGGALFEEGGTEGVAFVLDLSEQKRAEGEIRALKDQLYRENLALRDENVRLEERTRIGQELHDTLLQTFMSASLQLGVALYDVPPGSSVKERLERILQLMQQGVQEGRDAIQGLRPSESHIADLPVALSRIRKELDVEPGIDFCVTVAGQQKQLPPGVQHEVYRIGREALVNAFSHSLAKRVELELEYSDSGLQMRIRDNGRGIEPQMLEKGRDGHWGLAGMRERATKIGGLLTISSSPTTGTEVQLSIPGAVTFELSAGHHISE